MPRTVGADDRDWEFLDRMIALSLDIIDRCQLIKDMSDDPDVLEPTLDIEGRGLLIQKVCKDYRPRLGHLKEKVRLAGRAMEQERRETNQKIDTPILT